MDVEGPGDSADGLPLIDEFAHERLLIWSHFWWSAEGDAALAGVDKTIPRSLPNKGRARIRQCRRRPSKSSGQMGFRYRPTAHQTTVIPCLFLSIALLWREARRSSAPTCRDG